MSLIDGHNLWQDIKRIIQKPIRILHVIDRHILCVRKTFLIKSYNNLREKSAKLNVMNETFFKLVLMYFLKMTKQ